MANRAFPDLRGFLALLQAEGDLQIIGAPVHPRLEIAEIHRCVIAAGGPALLVTHPKCWMSLRRMWISVVCPC